jgi:hypothetical protein
MADKDFGVKRINLISDPGTPAISIGTSTITYFIASKYTDGTYDLTPFFIYAKGIKTSN